MAQGRVLGADDAREYLVLPKAFMRDVCAGFDLKAATRCLVAEGWATRVGVSRRRPGAYPVRIGGLSRCKPSCSGAVPSGCARA